MRLAIFLAQAFMLSAVLAGHPGHPSHPSRVGASQCQIKATLFNPSTPRRSAFNFAFYKDGEEISYTTKHGPCQQNLKIVSPLPQPFVWNASCAKFAIHECSGTYGSQHHLHGDAVYFSDRSGIYSTCTIDFDC